MKKYLIFSFLVVFFMSAFSVDMSAQRRSKKKKKKKTTTNRKSEYFDERGGDIKDRLWYGADVNLNFAANNQTSGFLIGISPMVGYEITENFSVGPRLSIANGIFKQSFGAQDITLNQLNFGGGIFARHKFLQQYFVHAEYSLLSEEFDTGFIDPTTNKVLTERATNDHYYLGVGYANSAGALGFSAYVLWDFSQEFTSFNLPIDYRIGVTYQF